MVDKCEKLSFFAISDTMVKKKNSGLSCYSECLNASVQDMLWNMEMVGPELRKKSNISIKMVKLYYIPIRIMYI